MHDVFNYTFYGKKQIYNLNKKENIILDLLLNNKNRVVTYKDLIKKVYGLDFEDKYLRNCVKGRVRKLEHKLEGEIKIINIREVGYRIK